MPGRETLESIAEGIVFLAVPDGAVAEVAKRVARANTSGAVSFVHVSGALGLNVLAPLNEAHAIGSFHPLQSFPSPQPPSAFHGITVGIDASTSALERRLGQLARDLGARPRHVGERERKLYHAAAVIASNYVVALVLEAVRVLEAAGWHEQEAVQALVPLIEGTLANVQKSGVAAALTGPVRRGDADTVRRHLEALGDLPTEVTELYRMLGLVALEIAEEGGLDPSAAGRTRRALTRNVAATRRRGRT